ncbi:DUF6644 family protein [Novosphingobium sp. SG720]|uniref:DUF6644 family protein n=1 Tax=Novosphingobium TaxID=165696 RepID=UPI001446C8CB|nr:DUF6644 family protein [Novosphingobium sp. SG720]NKJ42191.1 hypothetical protein [Novosphingobium sp. SG720]
MEPDGSEGGLLQALYDSSIATAIRESGTLFPWIESTHVLMIAVVVGTIVIVDLRLLGFASHRRGARQLIMDMLPFTWVAFVIAAITGSLLFVSNATGYAESIPFRLKLVAIAIAGINMAVFHMTAYRKIGEWDDRLPTPISARVAGVTSLTLWLVIIFLGRWIGYAYPLA